MPISIGIDISKAKFDVCIYEPNRQQSLKCFNNTPAGFKAFARTLQSIGTHEHPCVIALEATGVYGDNLCHFLHTLGVLVYVINPLQIKYYSKSQMRRSKTDTIDAALIAQFMYHHKDDLHPWQPRDDVYLELRNLYRCRADFQEEKVRLLNRIEACKQTYQNKDSLPFKAYQSHLDHINHQLSSLEQTMIELVTVHEAVYDIYSRLKTIPGISSISALGILAESPDIHMFQHVKQWVAYAGLNSSIYQSGSSVNRRGHLSKTGSKALRKVFYMPALSAKNICKCYQPFVQRLNDKGKPPKVVLIAVMHKLLRILFAVLKKQKPFDHTLLNQS